MFLLTLLQPPREPSARCAEHDLSVWAWVWVCDCVCVLLFQILLKIALLSGNLPCDPGERCTFGKSLSLIMYPLYTSVYTPL